LDARSVNTEPRKSNADRYLTYIAGEWVEPSGSRAIPNICPAHKRSILGQVPVCTEAELDRAMQAAEGAFPIWRRVSGDVKMKIFLLAADIMEEQKQEWLRRLTREMGKSLFDAKLDLDEGIGATQVLATQGVSMKGETYPMQLPGMVMESRPEPRGVALIITPFNFPAAIPLAQIVAALVSGNTVVWKASSLVPETSQAITAAIEAAMAEVARQRGVKIPPGVFNLVLADGRAAEYMVRHPVPAVLSFTGSKQVGDYLDGVASGMGKRVMKEVAGINIYYVNRHADMKRAVGNFLYGKTITSGQRCTSIQELLCDQEVYEDFLALAIEGAKGVVMGDGLSDELAHTDATPGMWSLPPMVSQKQFDRLKNLLAKSVEQGGRIRYQGEVPAALKDEGYYFPLTLIDNVGPENVLYSEEAFGPVGVCTPVKDVNEAIRIINKKIGIVACIDSKDKDVTEHFIQQVLRTRVDDGRHGTGCLWGTRFGGDRGAGSGNPSLDENMVYGYTLWKTIYRVYSPPT
jgi:aldehyde dehydrogenase (NAD+)